MFTLSLSFYALLIFIIYSKNLCTAFSHRPSNSGANIGRSFTAFFLSSGIGIFKTHPLDRPVTLDNPESLEYNFFWSCTKWLALGTTIIGNRGSWTTPWLVGTREEIYTWFLLILQFMSDLLPCNLCKPLSRNIACKPRCLRYSSSSVSLFFKKKQ
jgi:hypothetical protein